MRIRQSGGDVTAKSSIRLRTRHALHSFASLDRLRTSDIVDTKTANQYTPEGRHPPRHDDNDDGGMMRDRHVACREFQYIRIANYVRT